MNTSQPQIANSSLSKVPEITLAFWLIKILTTGVGETTSDFLVKLIDPVVAVAIAAVLLAVSLVVQWLGPSFNKWIYWLAVIMVSIFGTMAADVLHVAFGIPYWASSVFFAAALAVIFGVWFKVEGTLSIHSITTKRREFFYWAAILTTFALGTAVGDLTANSLHLGYLPSGIVFVALFLMPAAAFQLRLMAAIPAFWTAYILTRPLGASFADWLGVEPARAGLGFGTGPVSLVVAVMIVGVIAVTD